MPFLDFQIWPSIFPEPLEIFETNSTSFESRTRYVCSYIKLKQNPGVPSLREAHFTEIIAFSNSVSVALPYEAMPIILLGLSNEVSWPSRFPLVPEILKETANLRVRTLDLVLCIFLYVSMNKVVEFHGVSGEIQELFTSLWTSSDDFWYFVKRFVSRP